MDLHQLDNWQSIWRALVALGLVFFPAYVFGRLISPPSSSRWLGIVLGFNCIGLIGLPSCFLPAPYPSLVLALLTVVAGVIWIFTSQVKKDFKEIRIALGGIRNWSGVLLLSAVALTLGPALTYPAGWDELTYHVELPRRWTEAGSINVQGDLPYSALPSLFEIACTLTYPIEGLITPRLWVWGIWLCGSLLLVQLIKQYSDNKNGIAIAVSVAASPIALMVCANCYVESLIWTNSIAILYLLSLQKFASFSNTSFLLAILIGASIATKMTSLGLLLLPVLFWFLSTDQDRSKKPRLNLVTILIASILIAAPFYVRTWWYCGNPVSPYYSQYISIAPAELETSKYHHDLAVGNFGMPGWIGQLLAPIAVAFANELYDGYFGYQWLILLGLGYYSLKSDKSKARGDTLWLGLSAVAVGCLWMFTSQQARFALPLYLVVVVLAAKGVARLSNRGQRWARWIILGATLISFPWTNLGYYIDSWLCVLKIRTPIEYIRDGIQEDGYIELTEYLHQQLGVNDKALSLFEHRLAYLPSQVQIGTPYFQSKYFANAKMQTSQAIIDDLHAHGINYLIITARPIGPDISSNFIQWQQEWYQRLDGCITDGWLTVIWSSGDYAVAKVNEVRQTSSVGGSN